ncbi:dienelactone hydrolase [Lipomyces arxii]|uniref:dienelactone hydrolase n=1 Tax=Lipomyces arxii TaxID=56418 RepID=UPI0034CDE58B
MASLPPGKCCTEGYLHSGTPLGTTIKCDDDFDLYIAKPKEDPTKCILYLSDIFGIPFLNHKILSDNFAKQGFLTLLPNLFYDDPAPYPPTNTFVMPDWLKAHGPEVTEPIIEKTIAYCKANFPSVSAFYAVGYCYGAKYVVRLLGAGTILAGYIAHPSLVTAEELKAIKNPLSIAAAETDHIFTVEKRHESEAILLDMKATYYIAIYSQCVHGFAVRGDPNNEISKWSHEAAFWQAVTWFTRF